MAVPLRGRIRGLACFVLGTVLVLSGCRSVGGGGRAPADPADSDPPIQIGASSPSADSAASVLIQSALDALGAGDAQAAAQAAGAVVAEYPSARNSSLALPVLAQAYLALESWSDAESTAQRYARLFQANDGRAVRGVVLSAQARQGSGDVEGAVRMLLTSPPETDAGGGDGMNLMRILTDEMDNEALASIAEGLEPRLLATPILIQYALSLWFDGDTDRAKGLAESVIALEASGTERELARAILDDSVESVTGTIPVLGAMLAETGSPGLTEFSSGIREGIEVALAVFGEDSRRPVRLEVLDDRGSPAAADAVVRRLEDGGALGVVGPVLGTALAAAAPARTDVTPIISPSARALPEGASGVYSLSGPDDGAARALAGYASAQGLARVVVLRPTMSESIREADAFRRALEDLGLQLVREIAYDSGATFFQAQLEEVASLQPDALVLPLPAADVELLAPQITFFGLDTLDIQLMGTAAWTTEGVVASVDSRHTNGLVAAAATIPGSPTAGQTRFLDAYESHMRRTLRSPVPALGYDAASLLLEAIRTSGARTPEDVLRGLEGIRDFPGATGSLSVLNGRVTRRHRLVRFEAGVATPLDGQDGN